MFDYRTQSNLIHWIPVRYKLIKVRLQSITKRSSNYAGLRFEINSSQLLISSHWKDYKLLKVKRREKDSLESLNETSIHAYRFALASATFSCSSAS